MRKPRATPGMCSSFPLRTSAATWSCAARVDLKSKWLAMSRKVGALERRANELKAEVERLEKVRRELRAEIVPYERGGELIRSSDLNALRVRVGRSRHPNPKRAG